MQLAEIADYIQQRVGSQNITLGTEAGSGNGVGGLPGGVTSGAPLASYQHLPAKAYKSFGLASTAKISTFEKMKVKLTEFGKLSAAQIENVDSLMQALAGDDSTPIEASDLQILVEMLDALPQTESFPALDLARMAVLRSDAATTAFWEAFVPKSLALCQQASSASLEGPAAVAVPMLTLRLCANALASPCRDAVATQLLDTLACTKANVRSSNKNVRLSVATLLFNICFYLHSSEGPVSSAVSDVILDIVNEALTCRMYNEGEAVMRILVALGTLVYANDPAKKAAKALFLTAKVEVRTVDRRESDRFRFGSHLHIFLTNIFISFQIVV